LEHKGPVRIEAEDAVVCLKMRIARRPAALRRRRNPGANRTRIGSLTLRERKAFVMIPRLNFGAKRLDFP
jgi:hypothetical protein